MGDDVLVKDQHSLEACPAKERGMGGCSVRGKRVRWVGCGPGGVPVLSGMEA